ncbi:hypothetical protein C8F01DRAFT_975646 [Mycena amicta]|nr:hypothetical protein C8F01DRAFT_975646 [Mycena amicta]
MHIVLTGATGRVGGAVLRSCLASAAVTKLSILSRRDFPLPGGEGLDVQKATVIVHKDYESYPPSLIEQLKGAEACIWAQGISQTQVSKPEYIRITHDYPIAAVKAFSALSDDKFNFVYVSGEGADQEEKASRLFAKIKGRTEKELRSLPSEYPMLRIFNVRPGYVEPTQTERSSLSFSTRILHGIAGPVLNTLASKLVSPADVLAKVLVDIATSNGDALAPGVGVEDDGLLLRCSGIRRLGGLSVE